MKRLMSNKCKMMISFVISMIFILYSITVFAGSFENGEMEFFSGDYVSAYKNLKIAADQGNGKAAYYLGLLYKNGNGVKKSDEQANYWFTKGAQAGDPDALDFLGLVKNDPEVRQQQSSTTTTPAKSVSTVQKQPYQSSMRDVESAYKRGDFHQAFTLIVPIAEAGNQDAQYNLGVFYTEGIGVSKSNSQALGWFLRSANQGHAGAQFNLANMYREGKGVAQSAQDALSWYRRAADQNYAKAYISLGLLYAGGHGVEFSFQNAEKWLRKAGDQGDADGYFYLANIFHSFLGSKNEDEALTLYGKAATLGNIEANGKIASIKRDRAKWAAQKAEYDREHPESVAGNHSWKDGQTEITQRINGQNACKRIRSDDPRLSTFGYYVGTGPNAKFIKCF